MFPLRDTQPSSSKPVVTTLLIAINVVIFLHQMSLDPYSRNEFISVYGLTPAHFHVTGLLTSMFLHGGWIHLIGNMWFLWIFGDNVEDILGHGKYLLFYLLCGLGAAVAHLFFNFFSPLPTVGASGAIAGVMGAYMVKFPRARILTLIFIFVFFTTVEVPAVVMLAYWFLIQLFSGVETIGYSHLSQGGVAWFAHVGGFVAGIVLVYGMRPRQPHGRRRDLHW
jgi:membrane associated rhomboid family serine protease